MAWPGFTNKITDVNYMPRFDPNYRAHLQAEFDEIPAYVDGQFTYGTGWEKNGITGVIKNKGIVNNGTSNGGQASSGSVVFPLAYSIGTIPTVIPGAYGLVDVRFVIETVSNTGFSWRKYGTAGNYDALHWIATN